MDARLEYSTNRPMQGTECACLLCRALSRRMTRGRPRGAANERVKRAAELVLSVVSPQLTPSARDASPVEVSPHGG